MPEVGILSRIVELRAHVTEWKEPTRVSFTLILRPAVTASTPCPSAPTPGLFHRILTALEPEVEDLANKIAAHVQGWPRVEGR